MRRPIALCFLIVGTLLIIPALSNATNPISTSAYFVEEENSRLINGLYYTIVGLIGSGLLAAGLGSIGFLSIGPPAATGLFLLSVIPSIILLRLTREKRYAYKKQRKFARNTLIILSIILGIGLLGVLISFIAFLLFT